MSRACTCSPSGRARQCLLDPPQQRNGRHLSVAAGGAPPTITTGDRVKYDWHTTAELAPNNNFIIGAEHETETLGFGALHYPVDASTIAWGFVIGAVALVATAAASAVLRALPQGRTPLMLAIAFAVTYAAYELALFAATPFLGGEGAFTAAIVTRIGLTSAVWLAGLVAACEIVRLIAPFGRGRATA